MYHMSSHLLENKLFTFVVTLSLAFHCHRNIGTMKNGTQSVTFILLSTERLYNVF